MFEDLFNSSFALAYSATCGENWSNGQLCGGTTMMPCLIMMMSLVPH